MSQTKINYGNGIAEGLIKSAMMIADQNKRRAMQPSKKPRYIYVEGPPVLHAKKALKKADRIRFEEAKAKIAVAQTQKDVEDALAEVSDLKLKSVPTKRALFQDYSRSYNKPISFLEAA